MQHPMPEPFRTRLIEASIPKDVNGEYPDNAETVASIKKIDKIVKEAKKAHPKLFL